MQLELRREALTSANAMALIEALNAELSLYYPERGANYFRLDSAEVDPGAGLFIVGYLERRAVGCGAVRRIDPDTAEIKRMYVLRPGRGLGVGRAILTELELQARALGCTQLLLETGERQLDAMRLYLRAGFERTALFGEYRSSPLSVCMKKTL